MRRRGFTLIEVMIAIAIIAIVMAAPLAAGYQLRALQRETDASLALRSVEAHLAALHAASYTSLSPRSLQVGAGGWLTPGPQYLAEVRVLRASKPVPILEHAGSRVRVGLAPGTLVRVEFSYYIGDVGETHVVNSRHVTLRNAPPVRVEQVWLAQGERLVPLKGFKATADGLELPASAEGQVICVDYLGGRVQTRVRGEEARGLGKLLTLTQGQAGHQQVNLQVLRTGP